MENSQQIDEASKSALDLMARHGIEASPQNYTVFFGYCGGAEPAVARAVDQALKNEDGLAQDRIQEIYEKHFGFERHAGAVQETGQKIRSMVGEILDSLGEAGRDQSAFGEKLAGFSGKLTEGATGEDAGVLVQGILSETHEILAKNQALEARLNESSREIDDLREHLEEVQREAMTDALTGIANRKNFDFTLNQEIAAAAKTSKDLCLLLADIDHFKKFNDTYGHQVGDEALKVFARTLKDGVKGRDTPARYGGEEFAVILPETSLGDAVTVADHIRETLASRELQNRKTGDSYGKVTLSIGVARYRPGESLDALVERADAALYRAKDNGRNRVETETLEEQLASKAG